MKNKPSFHSVDGWGLGCIIFEMLEGVKAFDGPSDFLIWQGITNGTVQYSPLCSGEARSICQRLLVADGSKRLGFGSSGKRELKKHPFFAGPCMYCAWHGSLGEAEVMLGMGRGSHPSTPASFRQILQVSPHPSSPGCRPPGCIESCLQCARCAPRWLSELSKPLSTHEVTTSNKHPQLRTLDSFVYSRNSMMPNGVMMTV